MAQTKTRGSGKSAKRASAPSRSRSQARKTQSSSRPKSTKRTTKHPKQGAKTKQGATSTSQSPKSSSHGLNGLREVPQAVEKTGKKVARNVGGAASKARTPLLASSAALAGAAGGLAIGAMRSRHPARRLMRKPLQGKRVKISPENVSKAARRIGTVSQHVADITGEMNGNRHSTNGHRRSPVEVVLEGLTARR